MKRGPKPSGVVKVPFFRRVVPDMIERLDLVINGPMDNPMDLPNVIGNGPESHSHAFPVVQTPFREANLKALEPHAKRVMDPNVLALLDDVDRLTKELEVERGKVKKAMDMDLDEKGKLGWRLYFQLKDDKVGGKSEFDQT